MNYDNLEEKLQSALEGAEALSRNANTKIAREAKRLHQSIQDYQKGCQLLKDNNAMLTIGVVGQMNAGKSTLLNSMIFDGDPVLPKAATPMTAGLTIMEYTDGKSCVEAEYYTRDEWDIVKENATVVEAVRAEILSEKPELADMPSILKNEIAKRTTEVERAAKELVDNSTPGAIAKLGKRESIGFTRTDEIQGLLKNFVGRGGAYTSVVKSLYIKLNDPRLKDMRIVDTPGVNDPVISREMRTREFLKEAHGVLMLTMADRYMSQSDIDFLNSRISAEGVNSVLILGSRMDQGVRTPQYKGWPLKKAVDDLVAKLWAEQQKKQSLLTKPDAIVGMELTAGIAFSIAKKLKDAGGEEMAANLDEDEKHALQELRFYFPDDFDSHEHTFESLDLLANFGCLREDYIDGCFLERKQEIINSKLQAYHEEHIRQLVKEAADLVDIIKAEISFINDNDLKKLSQLVNDCEKAVKEASWPLQTAILEFEASLQSELDKIINVELKTYVPYISSIPTEPISVKFKRKGTRMGMTHDGEIIVDIPNREAISANIQEQMDNYASQLHRKWDDAFSAKRKELSQALLDPLTKTSANFRLDDKMPRMLIDNTLRVQLEGRETLKLRNIVIDECIAMNSYMRGSQHACVNTSFGKLSPADAERKLKEEAEDRCNELRSGINARCTDYTGKVDKVADTQLKDIIKIMEQLRVNLSDKLSEQISEMAKEYKVQLQSKQLTLDNLNQILTEAEAIKATVNSL